MYITYTIYPHPNGPTVGWYGYVHRNGPQIAGNPSTPLNEFVEIYKQNVKPEEFASFLAEVQSLGIKLED